MKKCSKCKKWKPLNDFPKRERFKDGLYPWCNKCNNEYNESRKEYNKKYYVEHGREKRGSKPMYENKDCTQYLGVVVGERLCRHLFKDVEVMPNGNPGFDMVCNKGKKIDVKAACLTSKRPHWQFTINKNIIADYFILVAFDNRIKLTPLHLWMIPGEELNSKAKITISPSTVSKWNKWEKDINDVQLCCTTLKK